MKDELLYEKRSYIDKSVLTFISLVKFISPNNQMYKVLIGNKDWLKGQINDFSKKFICICVDSKIENTNNIFSMTTKEVLSHTRNMTLVEKSDLKGISEIDGYVEDQNLVNLIHKLKKFLNVKKINYIPEGYEGVLLLSHDIDYIETNMMYRLGRVYYLLNYLRLGKIVLFFKNFTHFVNQMFIGKKWGYVEMLEIEKEFNITSTWFLFSKITKNNKLFNPDYELHEKKVEKLIKKIKDNNSEIALHSSPESAKNSEILKEEKKNLEIYSNEKVVGNRHHMGRFNPNKSCNFWIENNFEYDASFLTNDKSMDISSTNHFFKIYDDTFQKSIIEFPTQWMDVQYLNFSACSEKEFKAETFKVIDNALKNNHVLSMNWHGIPYNWYTTFYGEIIEYCIQEGFFISGYSNYLKNLEANERS